MHTFFFDWTTFYILGQKFIKFLSWFFGKLKTPKSHFEINWPLAVMILCVASWEVFENMKYLVSLYIFQNRDSANKILNVKEDLHKVKQDISELKNDLKSAEQPLMVKTFWISRISIFVKHSNLKLWVIRKYWGLIDFFTLLFQFETWYVANKNNKTKS